MAQVTIEINGRPYTVGRCEDGQENHLVELSRQYSTRHGAPGQPGGSVPLGDLGETRLFLMGATLFLADELADAQGRLARVRGRTGAAAVRSRPARSCRRRAIDTAAHRIETLAAKQAG